MDSIRIGDIEISRFIIGSNPFSGFSHQGAGRDTDMKRYFTTQRIKDTLHDAERLGITALIARTDFHVIRMLLEYHDEGGRIQWMAQTCPEVVETQVCVKRAAANGAIACHVHGGTMDHLLAHNKLDSVRAVVDAIRANAMLAGIAGHNPGVFEWAEKHLDVDYYMCCHYNPIPRDSSPEHVHGFNEVYLEEDREAMTKLIAGLSKPVIHYKILAAGRNDPAEAFGYAAQHVRDHDAVCVGVFPKDMPDMLARDVDMFETALRRNAAGR